MNTPKSDDKTLIAALRILSRDIQSEDGVANACIAEAANRIEELTQVEKGSGVLGGVWVKCSDFQPPEGFVVLTKINDGNERKLRRIGPHWFYANRSEKADYTPTHWQTPK